MEVSTPLKKRVRRTKNVRPMRRDCNIFFEVWSHRYLNTFQIQKIVDPNWNTTNLRNRLHSLVVNGYLQHPQALKGVWREGGGSDPKVYELAAKAIDYLKDEPYNIEEKYLTLYHRAPKSERPHITHTLMTSEVMAQMYAAAAKHSLEIIDQHTLIRDFAHPARDLRGKETRGWWVPMLPQYGIEQDVYIKPDRMFAIRYPGLPEGQNKRLFFVESDTGTEPLPTIEKKYRHYRATSKTQTLKHHFPAFNTFHVLFVTRKATRAMNMLDTCIKSPAGWSRFLISDMDTVKQVSEEPAQSFLEAPWYGGKDGSVETLENIIRNDLQNM